MNDQIARFGEIPLSLESELGRCMLPVREVLALAPGSVIRLTSKIGAKVDLFVGGAPFGSGELTKLGNAIGIRLTNFAVKKRE
ncbi:MAG TPA: FliM/FliN family flagellar motor switch protein [Bryobacteraceae bacterium]|nr:FliM/FliN family flagellar motor switch protein [Bryobacteraceae bacterium]